MEYRKCPICDTEVSAEEKVCPKCGHLMSFDSKANLETATVIFDEEEKKTLQKRCNIVSFVWMGIGALALLISIAVIVAYCTHQLRMYELILYLMGWGVVSFVGFFKFNQYQKYMRWVESNTKGFIDKFKNYNFIGNIIFSAILFLIAAVPVILTYTLISSKLNIMLKDLEQRTGKEVAAKKNYNW